METVISFVNKLNEIIDNDVQFTKRESNDNKLNLRHTLYASSLALKCSGISNIISDLEIDNIVSVIGYQLVYDILFIRSEVN